MKDKSKQVWYLYANNIKELKRQCYDVISTLYVQLGQAPEAEIIVHIRENDGPHFVNVPTWNEALRNYKMSKALKKQTNQIDQYELYQKRVESFTKAIDKREIKKIGNVKDK